MKFIAREKEQFDKRIHEIDLFRGFLICLVVFDHLIWFINFYIFKSSNPHLTWYWTSPIRYVVRQIVLCAFLFTCGISCHLSRNNKKRGIILASLCIGITIVTHLLQLLPLFDNRVVVVDFNILGVIALSILLFVLVEKRSDKDLFLVTIILTVFYTFIILLSFYDKSTDYHAIRSIIYSPINPIKEKYVADYLPLFPYIIFLFLGVLFARIFYKEKKSIVPSKKNWERTFCFLGRHTLIIYIAHEVLFTLIFMLIGLII